LTRSIFKYRFEPFFFILHSSIALFSFKLRCEATLGPELGKIT
jgi:hypothetical protein